MSSVTRTITSIDGFQDTQSEFFTDLSPEQVQAYVDAMNDLKKTPHFRPDTERIVHAATKQGELASQLTNGAKSLALLGQRLNYPPQPMKEDGTAPVQTCVLSRTLGKTIQALGPKVADVLEQEIKTWKTFTADDNGEAVSDFVEKIQDSSIKEKLTSAVELLMKVHELRDTAVGLTFNEHQVLDPVQADLGFLLPQLVALDMHRAGEVHRMLPGNIDKCKDVLGKKPLVDARLIPEFVGDCAAEKSRRAREKFEEVCRELNPTFMTKHFGDPSEREKKTGSKKKGSDDAKPMDGAREDSPDIEVAPVIKTAGKDPEQTKGSTAATAAPVDFKVAGGKLSFKDTRKAPDFDGDSIIDSDSEPESRPAAKKPKTQPPPAPSAKTAAVVAASSPPAPAPPAKAAAGVAASSPPAPAPSAKPAAGVAARPPSAPAPPAKTADRKPSPAQWPSKMSEEEARETRSRRRDRQ